MGPKLENKMGKWGATSYMIGNTIGAGIFITPYTILQHTTSVGLSLVIWLVSALATLMIALCYVELGTSIRRSGADFAYFCYVKWHSLAFAFMACGCLFLYPITLAVQAETFAEYVIRSLRIEFCDESPITIKQMQKLISFITIWLLLYLNFFSMRTFVARFQILASFAKLIATFAVIGIGIYVLCFTEKGYSNLEKPFANSTLKASNLTQAFFAGLFSYDGWDVLNYGVEELADPATSMLFAALFSMCSVTIIFTLLNVSYFTVLTVPDILNHQAIATTFGAQIHPSVEHGMTVLVSIVIIGSLNSTLFSASRFLFAAARSGQFPAWISCINSKHDSPRSALFFHVALAIGVSFIGGIDEFISYIGFSQWSQRLVTVGLLLYIRFAGIAVHPEAVRMPIIIPIVFFVICAALVVTTIITSIMSGIWTLVILLGSLLLYLAWFSEKYAILHRNERIRNWAEAANEWSSRTAQLIFNGIIELETVEEQTQPEPVESARDEKSRTLTNGNATHRDDGF